MPLVDQSPLSKIGSVFFSSDATSGGQWTLVNWTDWSSRTKKVKSTVYGLDGAPFVSQSGLGAKGRMTLHIPSCYVALYNALRALANGTTHHTALLYHPTLGTISRDVVVIDVITTEDDQWTSDHPIPNVYVRLESFGAA
jgi:hypothetical protein